jgi:hypothetical protein
VARESCRDTVAAVTGAAYASKVCSTMPELEKEWVGMADILQFPTRQPPVIERLDASITCMHRLHAASGLAGEEVRVEALSARLDIASLREAMQVVLSGSVGSPLRATEIEDVWVRLECLLDQVAASAQCSSENSSRAEERYAMRVRLGTACRSTLAELHRLRSLLVPTDDPSARLPTQPPRQHRNQRHA